ncbi:hypothetical protein HS1genome_1048 [Sulfodiicoccus acidiphilus]|uniref:H/ACA RNA-protein complex protein Gar1 n=1 Tax=Sulfodiicoccus acidiphilus TaxID=1670455 RepID=A0A348B3A7_9CREN|nr:hypothetical protein [Sulfodiicoccus acidiphilus]BBD72659.1 hypothetical protein HS1genome_1048 [Sulfodiicoccus acidiphilus]GGT95644.1 hypothetical protein GCM10007116_11570 [Sulfodiicoccus acidiphilus]
MRVNLGRTVSVYKEGLRVVSLDPSLDYERINIIGKTVRDKYGNAVGRVLDVIGNVKNPYALVKTTGKWNEETHVRVEGKRKVD